MGKGFVCLWILWHSFVSLGALLFTSHFLPSLSHQTSKEHQPLLSHLTQQVLSQDLFPSTLSRHLLLILQQPSEPKSQSCFQIFPVMQVSHFLKFLRFYLGSFPARTRCTFLCSAQSPPCGEGSRTEALGFRCLFLTHH